MASTRPLAPALRVIALDPRLNEFIVAGSGATLLRTVERARLAKIVDSFERPHRSLFHQPSQAMLAG